MKFKMTSSCKGSYKRHNNPHRWEEIALGGQRQMREGLLEPLAARRGNVYPKVPEETRTCLDSDFKLSVPG